MAVKAKKQSLKKITRKEVKNEIYEKLSSALSQYKTEKDKKFERRISKASKLFVPLVVKFKLGKKD
jgi:hypothetical protein